MEWIFPLACSSSSGHTTDVLIQMNILKTTQIIILVSMWIEIHISFSVLPTPSSASWVAFHSVAVPCYQWLGPLARQMHRTCLSGIETCLLEGWTPVLPSGARCYAKWCGFYSISPSHITSPPLPPIYPPPPSISPHPPFTSPCHLTLPLTPPCYLILPSPPFISPLTWVM